MHSVKIIITIFTVTLMVGGCMPSSKSGSVYSRNQARQVQQVEMGKVVSVRSVRLEGTKSPVGSLGGAIIGGIAGSTVGGGRGKSIATTVGAIAGGLAGAAVEEGVTRDDALEITVQLDDGRMISIVQTEPEVAFQAGEPVRVLTSPTATRVTKMWP
ncbi:MAG: glycine zipper 2TM domain-containing protein [Pseudomonadota bacterium]|nr:glycine zipper 2TM domain-containing protein [Pseudomonadota bacterium]